jgi:prolyl-tRNA synthetase
LQRQLADFRVFVDLRDGLTPGFKFHDWELRGVPVRLEIGPKDMAQGVVTAARRDRPGKEGKQILPEADLADALRLLLEEIHHSLLARARAFQQEHTHEPKDYASFQETLQDGWARVWWCGETACEKAIQEDTHATTRNIPLDQPGGEGKCIRCGKPAREMTIFARAY